MPCYDTMLLDRYQAGVDADYEQQEAKENAIERAGEILARELKGMQPADWAKKRMPGGWTMDEMLADAVYTDSDITTAYLELMTSDHPLAKKLRDLLIQTQAEINYLNIA